MKLKIWIDSGANAHSKRVTVVELKDIGITDHEWSMLTENQKEEAAKSVAFETLDWGFEEMES